MLAQYHGGTDIPFYVTEMGWPTHITKGGTDPELSASYLARLYLLARTSPAFKGLWWYDFQDDGWKPEYNEDNFGLVRPDLTPKPAFHVLADISELVGKGQYVGALATDDEHLRGLHFTRVGRDYWLLWSSDDQDRQVVLETEHAERTVMLRQLGHDAYMTRWGYRAWADRRAELVPNQLAFVVGHRPVMISGDLSGVSIAEVVERPRQNAEEK